MKLVQVGGHYKGKEQMWAMVDDDDYELVSQFKWSILRDKYTNYASSTKNRAIQMHRLIMGLEFGDIRVVNHKDGNGLNNQRDNLEICSQMYNSQSINKPNSNKGNVQLRKDCPINPWYATIIINKVRHSKNFASEEEARKFIDDIIESNKHLIIPL